MHLGERAHAFVGHVARDRAVVRERVGVLAVAAELGERAHDRAGRHHLAPTVADLLEQRDRFAAARDALVHPAAPQPHVGEEHVHHADGPAVAGLAAVDRDVLGERGGFFEPALVVADEREQPVRPTEPAPVAELGERARPTAGAAPRRARCRRGERDPREVLQRPRAAALAARRPVRGERLGHEPLGLHEIAAEQM